MRRRLFSIASAVSLLLCVATVALWERSYFTADILMVGLTPKWELACCSIDGRVNFCLGLLTEISRGQRIRLASTSFPIPPESDSDGPVPGFFDHFGESVYFEDGRMWGQSEYHGFPILIFRAIPPNWLFTTPPTPKIKTWFISPRDWQLVLVLVILPALSLARFLRTRARIAKGNCLTCGYNLTANTSGVCPECGTPVPQKKSGTAA